MSTDDTNATRRGSESNDLLGQIPVGALTDGEAAMLRAWAERFAVKQVAAKRERWQQWLRLRADAVEAASPLAAKALRNAADEFEA